MLAYLGDCVFELFVREKMVSDGVMKNGVANRLALNFVTAKSQSVAADKILPFLSEEEGEVFRRGKNVKPRQLPKNTTHIEYQKATALEAVFGYNYCMGRLERNRELFYIAFSKEAEYDLS